MALSRPTLKNIAADSTVAVILVGLSGPLWYLTTLVMARFYGAQAMGTYFIVWNLVFFIGMICRLGLDTGLLRFSAVLQARGQGGSVKRLFWPAIGLMTLTSIGAAAALFFLRDWLAIRFNAPQLPETILFVAPALPLFVASFGFRETIRALGGVRFATFQKNSLIHVSFIAFLLLLAYVGGHNFNKYTALGAAAFLSYLINLGFLAFSLRFWIRRENSDPGECSVSELFWYSLPLFLHTILPAFSAIDRLILGYFSSPQEVAYYEVAAKAGTIITLPLLAVNNVIPPLVAKFYEYGNLASLELVAQTTARWSYYLTLPIAVLLILLSPELLGMFGADFVKARFALIIISLAQVVNAASGSVGFILNMTGHQWQVTILRLTTTILAVVLMIFLTKHYGLNGVACASALGLTGINIALVVAVWSSLKIKAFARGISWINVCGLLGALAFFLSKPLLGPYGAGTLFMVLYLALVAKNFKREFLLFREETA